MFPNPDPASIAAQIRLFMDPLAKETCPTDWSYTTAQIFPKNIKMMITPVTKGLSLRPNDRFRISRSIGKDIMAWVIEPWMALVVRVVVPSLNRYALFRGDSLS
jgi:hypothetical protein